ncbi:hypothetical protein C1Y63_09425 [Corynebacterium sp. 13CS0277]|uniref:hypothetical protein n=1 Tax=Corynebacterium sp. 13CS0277 TaxID=2071994 RepID=UPI000D029C29|nr:hypothetical protein [Corynebacterium sp. 13CS0277]PRQ10846.1 hypothetical protein C1Y63_09425 [Corynebacterium sp. 13CS0277]
MPALGFARIGVGQCVGRGASAFVMSWPKWVAFSFVYGITFGTLVSQAVANLTRSCVVTGDEHLVCDNWGFVGLIAVLLVVGVAIFVTVCAVWTQRRAARPPHWARTFAASLPVSAFAVVGTLAVAALSQHLFGESTLPAAQQRPGVVAGVIIGAGVVSLLAAVPVAFAPIAVADGRSFAFGLRFFRHHRAATVRLVGVTLAVVVGAVLMARVALYVVPLFALLVPVVVLMWMEAYWQGMAPIDEVEMAAAVGDEFDDDLRHELIGNPAIRTRDVARPADPATD